MTKIVLASKNAGKHREISVALSDLRCELLLQDDFSIASAEEDQKTFIENALKKARHVSRLTGLPSLADDSGLVVSALDGRPGIYSARFAGENATDQDNTNKLLTELAPGVDRSAYFYCVMVYLKDEDDPTPIIAEGKWLGSILPQPVGQAGFGYDPIFYVTQARKSAAELSIDEKNKISHRGQALTILKTQLMKQLPL